MTNDRTIALSAAAAGLLWPLSLGLVLVDMLTRYETGQLGILAVAAAATLTIRGYFTMLLERERNAFEIGRDLSRPRSLR